MIQPKIILCEGKSAYTKVLQHDHLKPNWDGDVAYTNWNGIHVVGYKRLFSQVKGKEEVGRTIMDILKSKS